MNLVIVGGLIKIFHPILFKFSYFLELLKYEATVFKYFD